MTLRVLLIACSLMATSVAAPVTVTTKAEGDHHTIVAETPLMRVTVVPGWGGRIVSLRMPHKTCFAPFYPTIEIVGYFHKAPMHRDFVRVAPMNRGFVRCSY